MSVSPTIFLGVLFLILGFATTFTMFQFWGYPFDKVKNKSECPQWKMNIHRALGVGYVIVYVIMMTHMLPRLWQYQVEFPARTVAHIILGGTIGFILIIKLSILRWFRHFEEWMPVLGTSMLLCTVLLTMLSVPFFFKEAAFASGAVSGNDPYEEANRTRVAGLLEGAGFEEGTDLASLTEVASLKKGRQVLLKKCVFCHDLKTAIDRPRTPENWVRTTSRMAKKPTLGSPISQSESEMVATYLISITPDLQKSAKEKRKVMLDKEEAESAVSDDSIEEMDTGTPVEAVAMDNTATMAEEKVETPSKSDSKTPKKAATKTPAKPVKKVVKKEAPKIDAKLAASTFKSECSQCHGISDVDNAPPKSRAEINSLIKRMVGNGFDANKATIRLIKFHMAKKYL